MDKLKSIMAAKKPQNKIVSQKEQLMKKQEEYLKKQEELKQQADQTKHKRVIELEEYFSSSTKKIKQDEVFKIPFSEEEIKQKLEELYQPPSLEGETEEARYRRYVRINKIHEENPKLDMKTFDENFFRLMKAKEFFEDLNNKYRDRLIEPKLLEDPVYQQKKLKIISDEKDVDFEKKVKYAEVCDEIYLWIYKTLREWKEKLDQKYNTEELRANSGNCKLYTQTTHQLGGLLNVLKDRGGDKGMIVSMYHIANCCLVRQYVHANDNYILLSIGKAPWPMGVAMLSINVKRNAEKLTHVLDDETTRKWIQGIKRLITISQQLFPNEDVLKMFHTVAGSVV